MIGSCASSIDWGRGSIGVYPTGDVGREMGMECGMGGSFGEDVYTKARISAGVCAYEKCRDESVLT